MTADTEPQDEIRYRAFVAAVEAAPLGVSPLMFVAAMPGRPPEASTWLRRWLDEAR